ncbi:ABCB10, partial [Symbiodinium microadriaticum]
ETDSICAGDLKLYVERILRRENLAPESSFHISLVLHGRVLRDDAIISGPELLDLHLPRVKVYGMPFLIWLGTHEVSYMSGEQYDWAIADWLDAEEYRYDVAWQAQWRAEEREHLEADDNSSVDTTEDPPVEPDPEPDAEEGGWRHGEVAGMDALTRAERKRLRPDKNGYINLSGAMSTPADVSRWVSALREWTPLQSQVWIDLSRNNLDGHDAADVLDTLGTSIHHIDLSYNQIKSLRPLASFLYNTRTGLNFHANDLSLGDTRRLGKIRQQRGPDDDVPRMPAYRRPRKAKTNAARHGQTEVAREQRAFNDSLMSLCVAISLNPKAIVAGEEEDEKGGAVGGHEPRGPPEEVAGADGSAVVELRALHTMAACQACRGVG